MEMTVPAVTSALPAAMLAFTHDAVSRHRALDHASAAVRHRHWHGRTARASVRPIIGQAFAIDELIPTALIFFTVAAALGWFGNRFWPEDWMHNPLL
jgi:hypothetical protein